MKGVVGEFSDGSRSGLLHSESMGGAGSEMLLLHGVGRSLRTFNPLVPYLVKGWKVHGIDLRGHGRSFRMPGAYRVKDHVPDILRLLDVRGPSVRVVLYGHSLGAMVAAALAAQDSGRVAGLILEDPPFHTMGRNVHRTPWLAYFSKAAELAGSDMSVSALVQALGEVELPASSGVGTRRMRDVRSPEAIQYAAASLAEVDPEVFAPVIDGSWLDDYDEQHVFESIRCPVLVLQADPAAGGALTDVDARRMEERIPTCEVVRVSGVGHLIHWDHAARVAELIATSRVGRQAAVDPDPAIL